MIRVLVAGLGNMGRSHALAYHHNKNFEIVGLMNRSKPDLPDVLNGYGIYSDFARALTDCQPDLVAVCTYTDSHSEFAISAMRAGAHVFVEKPLASTAHDAQRVIDEAVKTGRKMIVGYILRHHPSWQRLIVESRALGGPYVFRMNLNQQSSGQEWDVHKNLMKSTSPIVDCGVHYVDVMCQITDASPKQVRAMGVRLSDEIAPDMYNYGHFQVLFDDDSIGWYEAAWGPMISETAYFVKDVMSPNGAVSIVEHTDGGSSAIDSHTRVGSLRVHKVQGQGEIINLPDEPGHQDLCDAQAAYVADAILNDLDISRHMSDALNSLAICLAADESVRTGQPVDL